MIRETKGVFRKQKIEILTNRLFIIKKSWFKYLEYEVLFDNIETTKTVKRELNRDSIGIGFLLFIIGIVFNMVDVTIVFFVLFILSVIFILVGLFTKRGTITINNDSNEPIVMVFKKRDEAEIREFADVIINKTNEYLIDKYSRVDKDLPIENQLNSLEFLRTKDLISNEKFEELKNKLLGKKGDNRKIGFE